MQERVLPSPLARTTREGAVADVLLRDLRDRLLRLLRLLVDFIAKGGALS